MIHYLPHQPVIKKEKSTTKVRIVYDGSATDRSQGKAMPSLNDCLFKGPCLLKDLAGILMRFRRMPIAITADIEKAFLQICIRASDRDACRFLWVDNPERVNEDELYLTKLKTFRFKRVAFGLSCSPFLLNATIAEHMKNYETELTKILEQNI